LRIAGLDLDLGSQPAHKILNLIVVNVTLILGPDRRSDFVLGADLVPVFIEIDEEGELLGRELDDLSVHADNAGSDVDLELCDVSVLVGDIGIVEDQNDVTDADAVSIPERPGFQDTLIVEVSSIGATTVLEDTTPVLPTDASVFSGDSLACDDDIVRHGAPEGQDLLIKFVLATCGIL
jgi:hypothetical protein